MWNGTGRWSRIWACAGSARRSWDGGSSGIESRRRILTEAEGPDRSSDGRDKVASGVSRTEVGLGDKKISFETGKLAKQASGPWWSARVTRWCWSRRSWRTPSAMWISSPHGRRGSRHVRAGKIPGGFIKKEGRPSDQAILNARSSIDPSGPCGPRASTKRRTSWPPCSRSTRPIPTTFSRWRVPRRP